MESPTWQRVRAVVERALELADDEREAFLAEVALGEPAAAAEARALLAQESRPAPDPPLDALAAVWVGDSAPAPGLGTSIGGYELVRSIASGGMGVVYEARQRSPQRTVALKVLRTSFASPAELSRFRFESEVLARLHHPGIAQVYESGVHVDERPGMRREIPFFALEFVDGARSLTEFARERRLSLSARLELFLQACDAIHHGHTQGVVHRDVKPSNLLVDAAGRVKVIDFGIARSQGAAFGERTFATSSGELVGTPHYMSPEQFGRDGGAIDTRSDVYALGVVLYELVSGRLPLPIDQQPLHEIARMVTFDTPRSLRATDSNLPAELDWIARKALEKQPERRYASAAELASDVRRFLAHEPVQARRPSVARRLTLVVKRNRLASAVGVLAVAALVLASALYARDVIAARELAEERLYAATVAAATGALRAGDAFTARTQLEAAPERFRRFEHGHLRSQIEAPAREFRGRGSTLAQRTSHGSLTFVDDGRLLEHRFGDRGEPALLATVPPQTRAVSWSADGERCVLALHEMGLALGRRGPDGFTFTTRTFGEIVPSARFAPDGSVVACAVEDNTLRIFDADLERELAVLAIVADSMSFEFVDAERIVVNHPDGPSFVLHWKSGERTALCELQRASHASVPAATDRALVLAIDGRLEVRDPRSGALVERHALPRGTNAFVTSRDGRFAAVACDDGTLRALELETSRELLRVRGLWGGVESWTIDPRTSTFAAGFERNSVCVWDLAEPASDRVLRAHWGDATVVGFTPDSRQVLTMGVRDGLRKVFDVASGTLVRSLPVMVGVYVPVRFNRDGSHYAFATDRGMLHWADTRTHRVRERSAFSLEDEGWADVAVGARGDVVFAAQTRDAVLSRWTPGDGEPRVLARLAERDLIHVRFSPDAERIYFQDGTGCSAVARVSPFEILWRRDVSQIGASDESFVTQPAWLADGRLVLGMEARVEIVEGTTGERLRSTRLARASNINANVLAMAISPDGTRIALASQDSTVRLLESATLSQVAVLETEGGWAGSVAFSPDGRTLACCTSKGQLFLWRGAAPEGADPRFEIGEVDDARRAFAQERDAGESLDAALERIEARADLSEHEREALLRAGHGLRGTLDEVIDPALTTLVEGDVDPERRYRASRIIAGMLWIFRDEPRCLLGHGISGLRRQDWSAAEARLRKALRAFSGPSEPCWRAAQAGLAIALEHLGRGDEALAALREAEGAPARDPRYESLVVEARELLTRPR